MYLFPIVLFVHHLVNQDDRHLLARSFGLWLLKLMSVLSSLTIGFSVRNRLHALTLMFQKHLCLPVAIKIYVGDGWGKVAQAPAPSAWKMMPDFIFLRRTCHRQRIKWRIWKIGSQRWINRWGQCVTHVRIHAIEFSHYMKTVTWMHTPRML
jgi:hypothetical protein